MVWTYEVQKPCFQWEVADVPTSLIKEPAASQEAQTSSTDGSEEEVLKLHRMTIMCTVRRVCSQDST